jgi:dienelactone hydrolase
MQRILGLVAALAAVAFLVGSARLGQLERGGPSHTDLVLDGGVPATVYLPGPERGRDAFMDPPPPEERPPALVLVHGYAGDRRQLSSLARRLAASGTAVLAIDLDGHGENRNPFRGSDARGDAFGADLRAAVDFLRAWPFVDGSRIAVGGHSMGAGASLDYASRDSGIDAVVLISGGWRLTGPYRPPNALFVYAEGDPERTRARVRGLAARLAGHEPVEAGHTYGRHDRQNAVRLVEIEGADHASVVWNEQTVDEIAAWLDAAFARAPRHAAPPADPRAALLPPLLIAFVLLLPGLGLVIGRLVPRAAQRPPEGRLLGLGLLAAALFASMPLLATGTPGAVLSVEIGDVVVAQFALAGLALLVALRLRWPQHLEGIAPRPLASVAGAGVGVVAIVALVQPFGAVLHGLSLTPERGAVFAASTLGLLPLALASSALLRRGGTAGAALAALGGRLLVLLALIAGVRLGVLGSVVLLMVPPLAVLSLLLEELASSIYAVSRNLLAIAVVDAAWLALAVAAVMPVRV